MRAAVVDDEKVWREKVGGKLRSYFFHRSLSVDLYEDGEAFLAAGKNYDVIFLDVEMQGRNGLEIGEIYHLEHEDCLIVILTMHMEYSPMGYQIRALRFVDKTKLPQELPDALEAVDLIIPEEEEIICPLRGGGEEHLSLQEILYIETLPHGTMIHIDTEEEKLESTLSIGQLEQMLQGMKGGKVFFRSHRAYLVNLGWVSHMDSGTIYMQKGHKAFLSTRKYTAARQALFEYRFQRANG